MPDKVCTKCQELKVINDFHRWSRKKDGRHSWCKVCLNTRTNERRTLNRKIYNENDKVYKLKAAYGITKDQYDQMLDSQDHKCAICSCYIVTFTKQTHVDHCHITGKIRGLLCNKCNMGLGMFNDSFELIDKASLYLKGINE